MRFAFNTTITQNYYVIVEANDFDSAYKIINDKSVDELAKLSIDTFDTRDITASAELGE